MDAGHRKAFAVAVSSLLESEERRRELGQRARSKVETEFSISLATRRTLEWYREVLEDQ